MNLVLYISILKQYANHFWLDEILLKLRVDIEENPEPKPGSNQIFSICHWNLNSISAHNYIKVLLSRAYISTHKFDAICISETYLDSDASDDDGNLKVTGYNLIRANHPSNTGRGGVCIYYKHSPAFRLLNMHYLKGCMNSEISFRGKIYNFISLYRSPGQSSYTFEDFTDNLELKITNKSPCLLVVLGGFTVKSLNSYKHDKQLTKVLKLIQ